MPKGRPAHPLWIEFFVKHRNPAGQLRYQCKADDCDYECCNSTETGLKHIKKCTKLTEEEKQKAVDNCESWLLNSSTSRPARLHQRLHSMSVNDTPLKAASQDDSRSLSLSAGADSSSASAKKRKLTDITSTSVGKFLVPALTVEQSTRIDIHYVMWMIRKALPFTVGDDEDLNSLWKIMRPNYRPPSARQLSGDVLDSLYKRTEMVVWRTLVEEASVTGVVLCSDGSADGCGDPLEHVIALTPKPLLIKINQYTTESQTAPFLFGELEKVIQQLKDRDVEFAGYISDNENKMLALRDLIKEKYNKPAVGDSPHALALCFKDVAHEEGPVAVGAERELKKVVSDTKTLLTKIKNKKLKQFLKEECDSDRMGIAMAGFTRWNSHKSQFEFALANKEEILSLQHRAAALPYIGETELNIIRDANYWGDLEALNARVEPICIALRQLEGSGNCVSDVFERFAELRQHYLDEEDAFMARSILNRWNLVVDKVIIAAFFLDPTHIDFDSDTVDEHFWNECFDRTCEFIEEAVGEELWQEKVHQQFLAFRAQTGIFATRSLGFDSASKDARDMPWRQLVARRREFKELAVVAMQCIAFPQCAADVERSFSSVRHIQTWKRCALLRVRLGKLIYIHVNDRFLKQRGINIL